MEYVVRRKDYDYVQASVAGYSPVYGKFSDFFGELKGYLNRHGYVYNLEYRDHTLFIEKYDSMYGFLYTDSYVLDGLLESDARFMEGLNDLLNLYDTRKDELKKSIKNIRDKRRIDDIVCGSARKILEEYCDNGSFTMPSDPMILESVYELYKNNSPEIFRYNTCTMEGDSYSAPTVKLRTPKIKTLNALTGIAGVTSAGLAVATFSSGSFVTFAGCLAGIATFCVADRKSKKVSSDILMEKAKEITAILEEKCHGNGEDVKVYLKSETE